MYQLLMSHVYQFNHKHSLFMSADYSKKIIRSDALVDTEQIGFAQAVQAGPWLYLAGQVGWLKDFSLPGDGGLEAQAEQTMRNIQILLEAAGASFSDVVRFYLPDLTVEKRGLVRKLLQTYFDRKSPPVSTLIGVARLAASELLIEIEITACLPSVSNDG
ncbi:MAG: RidA family protein [Bacteroidota bacterium]